VHRVLKKTRCMYCKKEIINKRGRPRKYCKTCYKFHRRQYLARYRLRYRLHKPRSAWATREYYQFYKFLLTLPIEDLQVLFLKRKKECKYAMGDDLRKLRTEMSIIRDVVELLKIQHQDQKN